MFGRDWQRAEATIVASHVKKTSGDGMVSIREFVADVRPASGEPFRATLQEPRIAIDFWAPSLGDVVSVLWDRKSGDVKFDKHDPRISAKAQSAGEARRFEAVASMPAAAAPEPPSPPPARDPAARLATLDDLHRRGLLTDAEHAAQRQRVLDSI